MIYLDPNSPQSTKARDIFHDKMHEFVRNRIDNYLKKKDISKLMIDSFLRDKILQNLDDIIIGLPSRLIELNDAINPIIQSSTPLKNAIKYIFNYDAFTTKKKEEYDAYSLAASLDIPTCTYCNINYTNTIITKNKKKVTRPQFDHFFDKALNPLLAISFYNLIPCCSVCNTNLKGSIVMNLDEHLHPYIDNRLNEIKFSYNYSSGSYNGLVVKLKTSDGSKSKNTADVFALEELYNAHTGILQDMIKARQYYSDKYLEILNDNLLKKVTTSKDELYRIVFGTEIRQEDFVKRPFSKFKSDILKELGVID